MFKVKVFNVFYIEGSRGNDILPETDQPDADIFGQFHLTGTGGPCKHISLLFFNFRATINLFRLATEVAEALITNLIPVTRNQHQNLKKLFKRSRNIDDLNNSKSYSIQEVRLITNCTMENPFHGIKRTSRVSKNDICIVCKMLTKIGIEYIIFILDREFKNIQLHFQLHFFNDFNIRAI